jgi:hypothetical protein
LVNYLGNSYELPGYVKPSTGLQVITNSATGGEINYLTKDKVVVVCGVANIKGRNESSKELKYFVQNRRYTNVIMMCAPYRFNLQV